MNRRTVTDDAALRDALLADAQTTAPVWAATKQWHAYSQRIADELRRVGLESFQTNYWIVKGYRPGGVPVPRGPMRGWKKIIWRILVDFPGFNFVLDDYRHVLEGEHENRVRVEKRYAALVLDAIADQLPTLRIPAGLDVGGAEDAFDWRGHTVTAFWVDHLTRAADFYAAVPAETVSSLIEIGPGLGYSTLAHRVLNPHLRTIVNVDIAPVLYISTQFLRATGEFEISDYLAVRDRERIRLNHYRDKPLLFQLPPWVLPKIAGSIDYLLNAFSFDEMDGETRSNYVRHILPLVSEGAMLHFALDQYSANGGGHEPEFVTNLFRPRFPAVERADHLWSRYFKVPSLDNALLRRR